MRIEVDKSLEQLLDEVKAKEPSVYGRGHVETVRFIANYYVQHQPLEELRNNIKTEIGAFLSDLEDNIEKGIERALPKAAGRVITNLLTLNNGAIGDAQQPQTSGDPAARDPTEGR
jgi:hypothetical protein